MDHQLVSQLEGTVYLLLQAIYGFIWQDPEKDHTIHYEFVCKRFSLLLLKQLQNSGKEKLEEVLE